MSHIDSALVHALVIHLHTCGCRGFHVANHTRDNTDRVQFSEGIASVMIYSLRSTDAIAPGVHGREIPATLAGSANLAM